MGELWKSWNYWMEMVEDRQAVVLVPGTVTKLSIDTDTGF